MPRILGNHNNLSDNCEEPLKGSRNGYIFVFFNLKEPYKIYKNFIKAQRIPSNISCFRCIKSADWIEMSSNIVRLPL